ncbi:MAG: AtpZ/AtpI family protein [Planctomycetes bacterium]|nr:AtpZ/AtpI family protein [Planctomycetota bacterium]
MSEPGQRYRRSDARERTRRDFVRLRRREPGGGFWNSLVLVGSVGWPIVLLATGGAWLGRSLDRRFDTGVRLTLLLVVIGASVGTSIAFRNVRANGRTVRGEEEASEGEDR